MVPLNLPTSTVSKLTGASLRMLDYWARTKLLPPSAHDAQGKGTRRLYTFRDLVAILTVCKLRERKCPLQQIRIAVRYLKVHYPDAEAVETLARLTLITDGKEVYLLTDERQVMNVVTKQWVWSVPLGMLIAEANQKVCALPQEWTEQVKIRGRSFRLLVTQDLEVGGYVVECRELPGFLQRVDTPADAKEKAKEAIKSLLTFQARRRRSARVAREAIA
jgi:DNA-binding transcriptional MerR regulator